MKARRPPRAPPRRAPPKRARPVRRPGPKQRGGSSLSLETLIALPTYNLPNLSWDRTRLAFFLDTTGRQELYVTLLDRPKPMQVSHGEVPRSLRSGTLWDRKDRTIFFGKDYQGNENHDIYRLSLVDGHVEQCTTDIDSEKHAVDISPDDRYLLLLGNILGKGGRKQLNLWREELKSGTLEQLTDYPNPVISFGGAGRLYSPDGRWITYHTNESKDPKNQDLYRMRADGSEPERIYRAREGSRDFSTDWSPDGKLLAICSDAGGAERPGVLHVESREVRWFGEPGREETPLEFSPDGRWLLTASQRGVGTRVRLYEVASGDEVPLNLPPGANLWGAFTRDPHRLLLLHTDVNVPNEFLVYDRRKEAVTTLLPPILGKIDPRELPRCETVHYPAKDGRPIEALLFHPPARKGGARRGPALVEVHGGPTHQFYRLFNPHALFLASQGYTLLQPNIRGSTGYGVEFRDLNRQDWGGGDLSDVVEGAKFLRARPEVDPARVGVFGGSYGGYMTYLAVVKAPEVWKSACAIVGISDLELLWKSSKEHFRYYLREQMGDPAEHASLWRDRSAVYFAERMRAKLLMLHGANDPRCPVDQARRFRDRLLELGRRPGRDFEYQEYGDEGHGSSDIQQKLRMFGDLAEFFHRNL